MTQEDLKRLAELLSTALDHRFDKIDRRFDDNERRWEENDRRWEENTRRWEDSRVRFERIDGRFEQLRAEINDDFRHQLAIQREDFQHKLDLVVEGHQALAEKLEAARDELRADIARVDKRVTAVAADLAAHRRDTEAHRKGWRVRED
ncbi:hypothetical protein [Geoalkalibacter sp.]|uniref:hypothetical protein n=1 Tax=Geoalkalibacter sp. TaxID=3041440 RepID=UPI00272ECA19|nr:hypothetical protein [Geoalkalibacter sp.]